MNIRHSTSAWKGKTATQTDTDFVQFIDPHHGIRAAAVNLLTYFRKYKLSTVPEIIQRWAPPEDDNDTASYISSVTNDMDVMSDTRLDLEDPEVLTRLVTAMMKIECGLVPYPADQIRTAVYAAYSGGASPAAAGITVVPTQDAPPEYAPPPAAYPPPYPPPPAQHGYPPHPYPPYPYRPMAERPVPPLVDQPTGGPTRKVQAVPYGGLAGVPVAWLATALWNRFMPDSPMPVEIAMFIAALASTAGAYLAAYMTRNRATLPPPEYREYREY